MLRKTLLVLTAIVLTYALDAFAGYVLYAYSEGRSEASLSLVARFVVNPMIVILIGAFVGRFSRNSPIPVAILSLLPWAAVILSSPRKPTSMSGYLYWASMILIHLSLGAAVALLVWRHGRRRSPEPERLA